MLHICIIVDQFDNNDQIWEAACIAVRYAPREITIIGRASHIMKMLRNEIYKVTALNKGSPTPDGAIVIDPRLIGVNVPALDTIEGSIKPLINRTI